MHFASLKQSSVRLAIASLCVPIQIHVKPAALGSTNSPVEFSFIYAMGNRAPVSGGVIDIRTEVNLIRLNTSL
jgi:hypothetical protein